MCFLIPVFDRVGLLQRARASRNKEPGPAWNSGNALKSSEQSRPRCSQIPVGISRASSVDHRPGLGSGVGWSYTASLVDFEFSAFLS